MEWPGGVTVIEVNVKTNQREKFIRNGIPYDELDTQMIHLIDILNFKIGLKHATVVLGINHTKKFK